MNLISTINSNLIFIFILICDPWDVKKKKIILGHELLIRINKWIDILACLLFKEKIYFTLYFKTRIW